MNGSSQPASVDGSSVHAVAGGSGIKQSKKKKRRRRPNRAERRAEQFSDNNQVEAPPQDSGNATLPCAEISKTDASIDASRSGETGGGHAGGERAGRQDERGGGAGNPAVYKPAYLNGKGNAYAPSVSSQDLRAEEGRQQDTLYAALDLGTNNCRLLVARPETRGFRVVDAFSKIVRLGEGLGRTRRLSDDAMDRAVEALDCCRDKLMQRGVERFRLIATEACRAAENGESFIDRVRDQTGLSLEIVSRETEARLAVAGCASLVDPEADGVVLFDIGGGSSEIVWLDLRNRCGARGYALTKFIRAWISLPVGVVNLAERHGGRNVTLDVFEAMVADAAGHLESFALGEQLTDAICSGKVHMLGTSGTVTTLAGVHFGLKRYDRRRVDGAWLGHEDVSSMIDRLRSMPYEERVKNPCIGADRADLVLAGCAILEAIRRRWTCQRLRVADRGLREGILMELMSADEVWRRSRHGKWRGRRRQR
ncbi:Ppx/GppA family phosphatase [Stappia sp. GBMRC 2046]|uniref:Ppx/GppA family phosphatase n=1 Tax=Stappia sediminis TaxID=2692190 RepID=A0A7X3LSQ9_9HYPH|nr:Ppx/GppA family phosphatase [Stappia sediminis]